MIKGVEGSREWWKRLEAPSPDGLHIYLFGLDWIGLDWIGLQSPLAVVKPRQTLCCFGRLCASLLQSLMKVDPQSTFDVQIIRGGEMEPSAGCLSANHGRRGDGAVCWVFGSLVLAPRSLPYVQSCIRVIIASSLFKCCGIYRRKRSRIPPRRGSAAVLRYSWFTYT